MTTKTLYCYRSGLPLMTVNLTDVANGAWPLINGPVLTQGLLHPIYQQSLPALNKRLNNQIAQCEALNWLVDGKLATDIALNMSAIMWAMNCMWQPPHLTYTESRTVNSNSSAVQLEPSLPALNVVVGTAIRLLDISTWYCELATQRDYFPVWRVSKQASNLNWHGFAGWCDIAMDIIEEFESGKLRRTQETLVRERADALRSVNSAHLMRRLDYNKVWNWIDIQLAMGGISSGRRTTFKSLFMNGDSKPEDWMTADIEDLQIAIIEHCDTGNTITGFITQRLRHIKSLIVDFYDGFSVVASAPSAKETAATTVTLAPFKEQLAQLTEAPVAPVRFNFASNGAFLQAQAKYNILNKMWQQQQANNTPPAASVGIDEL